MAFENLKKIKGPIRIAVSAGEYSGDQHAARLVNSIHSFMSKLEIDQPLEVKGMGGHCLRDSGVQTVIDSEKSGALNGFNIPMLVYKAAGSFFAFARLLLAWRPDVLVLVDYPDFNLRLAKIARFLNIPVVYFIPPKMWAWRSGRVRAFKKNVDQTASIFPFETGFFSNQNYDRSVFVGHPFIEEFKDSALKADREKLLNELGIDQNAKIIAALPGSRPAEVQRHLPLVVEAIKTLRQKHPEIHAIIPLAPAVDREWVKEFCKDLPYIHFYENPAIECLAVSDCGLLKSGTCNLEAAFLNLPFVCFYTGSKFAAFMVKYFVSIKEYSLVNIVKSKTTKELIQEDASSKAMADEVEKLLFDSKYINEQKNNLLKVQQELASHDHREEFSEANSSTERAAALVMNTLARRPSPLYVFKRMAKYLKNYRKSFIAALLCMVVYGASDGVVPFLVKHILDDIFASQDKTMLTVIPLILVLFTIVRAAADFGQSFLMSKVGHNIVRDLRKEVHEHVLNLSGSYFVKNSAGAILSRFTSDVILVRTLLTGSLASIIRDSIRILALLVTAIYLDPVLALIAFIFFPLGLYPVYRFGKRIRSLSRKGQSAIGTLSSLIQEVVIGHKVVKTFCREDFERNRFASENERLNETFIKGDRLNALSGPVNEVLGAIVISAVILYGGLTVIDGPRSQGDFIAFLISVFLLYDPFKKLSRVNSVVQQGASGAERIFELLDTEPEIQSPVDPIPLGDKNNIEFEKVFFSYNQDSEPVLKGISISVPESSTFALVGYSGSGKSTLVDLIPRFIDPTSGTVRLGGCDISKTDLKSLRERVTMVSQHTFLFNDTVFNNIAYGKINASLEEVEEAAKAAHAYDFINELPLGFGTVIGQDGHSLSGGERQRISIARALLKDSPVLILDEATASLDNRSEKEVQAALEKLQENRTTLVIAHRLSTVREADCILVMENGEIVEAGRHEELINQGGAYAKLYALQFSDQDEQALAALSVN